ncbi:hypothetical protein H8D04_00715 [bacterium]|nr:hypothetical protein [bacterium]
MAQWRKVVVSGSSAVLSGLTLDTQLAVGQGGTGATTLTDGGVLLGSGTGAITATAVLSDGQMLVGDGTTDPSLESGATLRTSIGVGTADNVEFANTTVDTLTNDSTVAASHLTGSFTGSFVGDGSNLTGVAQDIDSLTALGGATIAQGDYFHFSDAGTEKKVTFSNLEDSVFANVSGDATIAAGGALTIAAGAVENSMLANSTISGISLGSNLNSLSITANGGIGMTSYNGSAGVSDLALDIDGMTDIGAGLADADLFIVDDGAVGTNRKTVASRIPTYLNDHANLTSLTSLTAVGTIGTGTWQGTAVADTYVANDLTISGGTVNNSVIGGSTAAAGTFTTLTVNSDLSVAGNLDVTGTVTTINSTNLAVADKFAIFASGSATDTDGGIVVQNSALAGYALGYDAGVDRWAFDANLVGTATGLTPDAYVGVVQFGTAEPDTQTPTPTYGGTTNGIGTIYVDTDDSTIWIYA